MRICVEVIKPIEVVIVLKMGFYECGCGFGESFVLV
jgi:hypothetical protein